MENLSTSSYDVTLGEYYYRETDPEPGLGINRDSLLQLIQVGIYNPFSEIHVKTVWGSPQKAELARDWTKRTNIALENIRDDDRVIWIKAGETILCHTNEYIGGF